MTTSSRQPVMPPGHEHDVWDSILQRLFATGLGLQHTMTLLASDPGTAGARIAQAIDDLDDMREIIQAGACDPRPVPNPDPAPE